MYAAKALVQILCERFNDPASVRVFIPVAQLIENRKSCIQEVLMHMCPQPIYQNVLSGLMPATGRVTVT